MSIFIEVDDLRLMPTKKHSVDAGWDLRTPKEIILQPGWDIKIDTGVRMEIPEGYMGMVVPRSGLGTKGMVIKNTVGVIDSLYRGNIIVNIVNKSKDNILNIEEFGRFAQIVIVPVLLDELVVVDKISDTARGTDGFGASGTK